jgi:hypothetical protein
MHHLKIMKIVSFSPFTKLLPMPATKRQKPAKSHKRNFPRFTAGFFLVCPFFLVDKNEILIGIDGEW